jgi:hypothetical protein
MAVKSGYSISFFLAKGKEDNDHLYFFFYRFQNGAILGLGF